MDDYNQAFSDHSYLWNEYGPAEDMTGGYVDSEDLDRLLKSPTRKTATACLTSQIDYWFQIGPDEFHKPTRGGWVDDKRVFEIAARYGGEVSLANLISKFVERREF